MTFLTACFQKMHRAVTATAPNRSTDRMKGLYKPIPQMTKA